MQTTSGESDANQFLKNQEMVKNLLETIDKKSLEEIKLYIETVEKQIKNKKHPYSQFSKVSELINTTKDGKGRSSLHFASSRGDIKIVDYLISLQSDLNQQDSEGNNAFFIAVQHGHLDLVKYLCDNYKQDPLQKRKKDISAIHLASSNGDINMIEFLLQQKANIEEPSSFGFPINWAAGYNQVNTVKYLIQKGSSLNGDSKGCIPAPLILSVDYNNKELFQILINQKADVNVKDSNGWSVVQLAAEKGNLEFIQELIKNGADVNYINQEKSALQLAFENKQMEAYSFLKKHTSISFDENQAAINQLQDQKQNNDTISYQPTKDKEKANALKEKGNILFKDKKYQEAFEFYIQAIEYDNQAVALYTNAAAACIYLQKYNEGLYFTKRAKVLDEKWVKSYFREAEIYTALNDFSEAAVSYWECLKREPDNILYKKLFEQLFQKAKEKNKKMNQ
ncbi:hypothetical protein IMG5_098360 [Ichthyophthirius multifiliis]|uniref:Ankyrin repeat protein n=1 Tax=Ichthyophthirius multifiliis TaxID=5932 RepID=G0QRY0_ICHMU|nr:hypothetical protein IMG5_098360 [Ichthyophthirius multifiliis]EGR32010.1 hypothetical protein IMG5_098360 [Ichthyophthirius multifiliis]|eukprot:XP_004035496.1 hypothetical protein IMG5_098360 [Ichthyophthirius multifiliis]